MPIMTIGQIAKRRAVGAALSFGAVSKFETEATGEDLKCSELTSNWLIISPTQYTAPISMPIACQNNRL